jgi:hypothetical protein
MEKNNQEFNVWYEKTWIVVVLCIVFFPVGLYALWKNSTISQGWKIGITAFFAFVVILNITKNNKTATKSPTEAQSTEAQSTEKKLDVVFDINALDGKNIDEIIKVLGNPTTNSEPTRLQLKDGVSEWDKSFKKDGYELLITYNPKTREVIDFFIGTKDPSGKTTDYKDLLQVTNVSEGSSKIIVEPVKTIQDPESFTGIKIKTKSSIDKEQKKYDNSKAGKIQKKHPDWSKEDCERIANKRIWIGMTLDMLKCERGNPNSANPSNYGKGTQWQWVWEDYTPSYFYGGDDQIITAYN